MAKFINSWLIKLNETDEWNVIFQSNFENKLRLHCIPFSYKFGGGFFFEKLSKTLYAFHKKCGNEKYGCSHHYRSLVTDRHWSWYEYYSNFCTSYFHQRATNHRHHNVVVAVAHCEGGLCLVSNKSNTYKIIIRGWKWKDFAQSFFFSRWAYWSFRPNINVCDMLCPRTTL